MAASGGRVVAAALAAAVAVAVALLLAGGADADCFDYCYKNCIANDKSMADYCNYACDKTCEPGLLRQRPLAAVGGGALQCQTDCVRRTCGGFRKDRAVTVACYGNCFNSCKTKAAPRPLRAGQPFFHEKQDDVQPVTVPDHPFHEKQDAVDPAWVPDHP